MWTKRISLACFLKEIVFISSIPKYFLVQLHLFLLMRELCLLSLLHVQLKFILSVVWGWLSKHHSQIWHSTQAFDCMAIMSHYIQSSYERAVLLSSGHKSLNWFEFQVDKQIKTNKPDSLLPVIQQKTDLYKPSIYLQSSPNGQSFLKLMRNNLSG